MILIFLFGIPFEPALAGITANTFITLNQSCTIKYYLFRVAAIAIILRDRHC